MLSFDPASQSSDANHDQLFGSLAARAPNRWFFGTPEPVMEQRPRHRTGKCPYCHLAPSFIGNRIALPNQSRERLRIAHRDILNLASAALTTNFGPRDQARAPSLILGQLVGWHSPLSRWAQVTIRGSSMCHLGILSSGQCLFLVVRRLKSRRVPVFLRVAGLGKNASSKNTSAIESRGR